MYFPPQNSWPPFKCVCVYIPKCPCSVHIMLLVCIWFQGWIEWTDMPHWLAVVLLGLGPHKMSACLLLASLIRCCLGTHPDETLMFLGGTVSWWLPDPVTLAVFPSPIPWGSMSFDAGVCHRSTSWSWAPHSLFSAFWSVVIFRNDLVQRDDSLIRTKNWLICGDKYKHLEYS